MNAPHCWDYIRSELKCTPHENTVCVPYVDNFTNGNGY